MKSISWITDVMLGVSLSTAQIQDRYFFLPEQGYVREALSAATVESDRCPRFGRAEAGIVRAIVENRKGLCCWVTALRREQKMVGMDGLNR